MERILNFKLMSFLETNGLINHMQYVCRTKRSTFNSSKTQSCFSWPNSKSGYIRLINDAQITIHFDSFCHRCNVRSVTLFYRYFYGRCSASIAEIIVHLELKHSFVLLHLHNLTNMESSPAHVLSFPYMTSGWSVHFQSIKGSTRLKKNTNWFSKL